VNEHATFLAFERMAQDSNLPTIRAVTTGFQPGTLPTRSAILERSMKDSNLRTKSPRCTP
jgi:hypothetical protein